MSDPTTSPPMTHQNKEGLEALIGQLQAGAAALANYTPHSAKLMEQASIELSAYQAQLKIYREALGRAHELAADARDRRSSMREIPPDDIVAIVEATRPIALSQNQEQSDASS